MSCYPNESIRRFDQQFAETTAERNERLPLAVENAYSDGGITERARCVKIVREIKEHAERDRDDESNPHASDRSAAACWADCASQILYEIESGKGD